MFELHLDKRRVSLFFVLCVLIFTFAPQCTYEKQLLGLIPSVRILDVHCEVDQQRPWQRPLHHVLDDGLRFSNRLPRALPTRHCMNCGQITTVVSKEPAPIAHLKDDFIVHLQHLAEAQGFQTIITLDAKHCTHDNISSAT